MDNLTQTDLEREISRIEHELSKKREHFNDLRRRLPPLRVEDYTFNGPGEKPVKLSSLFGDKEDLDRPWVIGHSGEGIRPHAASAT